MAKTVERNVEKSEVRAREGVVFSLERVGRPDAWVRKKRTEREAWAEQWVLREKVKRVREREKERGER